MLHSLMAVGLGLLVAAPPAAPTRYDLGLGNAQPVAGGVRLAAVPADSPLLRLHTAKGQRKARLEEGDIIQKVDGKPVATLAELDAAVQAGGGGPLVLTVLDTRTKQPIDFLVTPLEVAGPKPSAGPSKLHAVLVGDTLDDSIGKGCQADLNTLAGLLTGGSHVHKSRVGTVTTLAGAQATADGVLRAVAALPSRPADTVLVYVSSHGAFDPKVADPLSGGHYLALRKRGGKDLSRADLRAALADRPGRLKLLVTDACNVKLSIVRPPTAGAPAPGSPAPAPKPKVVTPVEKLLFAHAGRLDITAASPGETATGMDVEGGLFTLALAHAMTKPGAWPGVLAQTTAEAKRAVKGSPQTAKVFENTVRPADPPGGLTPLLDPPGEWGLPSWWGR